MKLDSILLATVLAALTSLPAGAARLGDAAAPLAVKEWIKGKPVDVKDGKNIYVVEFWATWCLPCKFSIPHLTDLQMKLKDQGVVFVGITKETAEKVKPFVQQTGTNMDYTVAIDSDEAKTHLGYPVAYGQASIPVCFVVGKDGKVLWFGNPLKGLDQALEEILAGKYDLAGAIKRDESRVLVAEYYQLVGASDPKAKEVGRKMIAHAGEDVAMLCDFAFGIVSTLGYPSRDFALAEEALDKAQKLANGKNHWLLGVRSVFQFESGKREEGIALAKQALALAPTEKDRTNYKNFLSVMEKEAPQPAPAPPQAAAGK